MASGMFTIDDLGQSSTFRELKAIYYVLLSFVEHLKHRRVKVFTDNQSAARIFRVCFSHGIALEAQWIPRSLNERADLLSRFVDKDDWRVNPSVFRLVDAKWGPHTIDRFASYYNAQLPRLTPSLLLLVAAVSTLLCRIGVERITGFTLRWVSSWTPLDC